MKKNALSILLFTLLCACSNSEMSYIEEETNLVNTVIDFIESNSSDNDNLSDSAKKEVEQTKSLIPRAHFTQPFTLLPPSTQDSVRCTFDGSEPNSSTPSFSSPRLIDTTTVVRCSEFLSNKIKQQTETYFVNETIHMPVVSISVDPY